MTKDSDMNLKTFAQPLREGCVGMRNVREAKPLLLHTYGDVNDELGGLLLLGIFVFLYVCTCTYIQRH